MQSVSVVRSNRNGFTLLELLIVMGLLSVVTALGMSVFVSVDREWDVRRAEAEMEAMAVNVFEDLERDMNDVLSAEVSGYSLRGVDSEKVILNSVPKAYWPNDEFVVPVQGTGSGNAMLYGRNVRYYVGIQSSDAENNSQGSYYSIVRTEDKIDVQTPTRGAIKVTPDNTNVTGFQVEYAVHGSDEWTQEWSRDELPAAIRVSISLQYASRPDVQIARKRVFPIHVR